MPKKNRAASSACVSKYGNMALTTFFHITVDSCIGQTGDGEEDMEFWSSSLTILLTHIGAAKMDCE